MIFWPHDPPEDAVLLVRCVGTSWVESARHALDAAKIHYVMGGDRRDDVSFFVPKAQREQAEKAVRLRDRDTLVYWERSP